MYNTDILRIDKEILNRLKKFTKICISKECIKIEKKDQYTILYFTNGQIFRCKGFLVDNIIINEKEIEKKNIKKILW